jgi:hypothetical protein
LGARSGEGRGAVCSGYRGLAPVSFKVDGDLLRELEGLWHKLKPGRLPRDNGGRAPCMPFLLYCGACGRGAVLRLPRNRGPPASGPG